MPPGIGQVAAQALGRILLLSTPGSRLGKMGRNPFSVPENGFITPLWSAAETKQRFSLGTEPHWSWGIALRPGHVSVYSELDGDCWSLPGQLFGQLLRSAKGDFLVSSSDSSLAFPRTDFWVSVISSGLV